ncbi:MAG: exo-alpha-sialidase [Armatimonadetes bacterium]|nr:exo-alpha-sialidase [Armatimonadota bacterium]
MKAQAKRTEAKAPEPRIVLSLPHGPDNPRNSEGAFVTLSDGRIMFAYSRYYGEDWEDHAAATISARFSENGGKTWSKEDVVLVENEGRQNVMSVSLLRLPEDRLALFYLRKNSLADCRLRLRTSADEGKSWSNPLLCIPAPGYFVVNNDRVVHLSDGRLIAPSAFHRLKNSRSTAGKTDYADFDSRGIAVFFLSDDGGKTWREGREWRAMPKSSASGLQEPGVVELRDGTLYCFCRTDLGVQYEMRSKDRGETWSEPRPSRFQSPCSPLSMKRIPATGDLLAVWNDHSGVLLERPREEAETSWGRTPLVTAISTDEGKSWKCRKLIESDPKRGFCYTALHFTADAVLMAYCSGGKKSGVLQDLCIRRVSLDWLYQ